MESSMKLGNLMRQLGAVGPENPFNQPLMQPMGGEAGIQAAPLEGETFKNGGFGMGRIQAGMPMGDGTLSMGVMPGGVAAKGMKPQGMMLGADMGFQNANGGFGAQYRNRGMTDVGNKTDQSFMFGLNRKF